MKIIIDGRPISKKNSKQIFYNKYLKRCMITSSKQWKKFEAIALKQIEKYQYVKFNGPIKIDYVFYFKGGMAVDVDNAMAGINDILQTSGIIDDDKNIVKGSFEIVKGSTDWVSEVSIELYE